MGFAIVCIMQSSSEHTVQAGVMSTALVHEEPIEGMPCVNNAGVSCWR